MSASPPITSIADLARLCGVSESTVSRALRDNPVVNAQTRLKVQQLAQQHNFTVNAAASNLRLKRSNTIALILLFEQKHQQITDPFMLAMIGAIADQVSNQGYDLLLGTSLANPHDWYDYYIHSRRADGIIVLGQGQQHARVEKLAQQQVPLVVWGEPLPHSHYCVVGSCNELGGFAAVSHLLARGCQQILMLGDIQHPEIALRYQGAQRAMAEAGLASSALQLLSVGFDQEEGYRAFCDYWQAQQPNWPAENAQSNTKLGVFAVSDMLALGALRAAHDLALSVPEQVALVGFDDITLAQFSHPTLSSVRQNTALAADALVAQLLAQLQGQTAQSQRLPVELIARGSS